MEDIHGRIIYLSSLYSTDKDFLKKCNIKNHSFVTDMRKGRNKNPGYELLQNIVKGTGCSGTWLLTGAGKMFGADPLADLAAEEGRDYSTFNRALKLIERIEQTPDEVKEVPLPEGIEIQLAELLVRLLKRRKGT